MYSRIVTPDISPDEFDEEPECIDCGETINTIQCKDCEIEGLKTMLEERNLTIYNLTRKK